MKYEDAGVTKYLIYRARAEESLTMYKTLPASAAGFEDSGVEMSTGYTYRVKAVFRDGTESVFSEAVQIKY